MHLSDHIGNLLGFAPDLLKVRRSSLLLCDKLEKAFEQLDDLPVSLSCVFAVGSVGRLEIGPRSDLDGVVVLENTNSDAADIETVMAKLEAIYARLGFQIAKKGGIYRNPISEWELLALQRRGSIDERPDVYGKRIQMLLDARPVLNRDKFLVLQEQVLSWFLPEMGKQISYAFLINELQRYFHSYASWQMLKFERTEDDGWYLRQAKLRVTRVITVGAMMLLIGISMHTGKKSVISESLELTPIERLISAFEFYGEREQALRLVECYEVALRVMLDEVARDELVRTSPTSLEEVDQTMPPSYKKVFEASAEMMGLLTQFVLNRRHDWPSDLYRNWMF